MLPTFMLHDSHHPLYPTPRYKDAPVQPSANGDAAAAKPAAPAAAPTPAATPAGGEKRKAEGEEHHKSHKHKKWVARRGGDEFALIKLAAAARIAAAP